MKWFFVAIWVVLTFEKPLLGFELAVAYLIFWFIRNTSRQYAQESEVQKPNPNPVVRKLSGISAGDLADLILLRLELQHLPDLNPEQQTDLNQRIDQLCLDYLASLNAVHDNSLWQKHRDDAWDLLNRHADIPLGLPPWRIETVQEAEPDIPITPIIEEAPIAAVFAIDESEHSSTLPYQADSPKPDNPDSTLNQYAWKPHEPSALERTLSTLSDWHSLAKPFLVQNIGWFIGVFCFIAGSAFLVHSTEGYTSNLIAFFSLFIFTLALLFGGYQLRRQRPDLEISSYVIFILSLLLIPLTTITATQLLITGDGFGLKVLGGGLVLVELGVFYVVVTLVSGLMDRSLQQGLPKFFLALTATQLLQVLLLALPVWSLLMAIHLLIFALLSTSIYLFAHQWLQSIFIDRYKIAYFAAGTLVYAAIVSFVFITTGNAIALPAGYYGFFLLLLCGLLFFIDAQLKQWAEQHTYLSRFSFLVYGLSVLALLLVAKYPIAVPSLVLAIGLYGFIVWRYLTLTPLTILLACYFWLYDLLVLQYLTIDWYLLAGLPVLFSLYKAAQWAVTKRQSIYLAVIVYRVLYSLLVLLTVLSLSQSTAGFAGMMTAITAGILVYYTLKSAPIAIFKPYSKIDPVSINSHQNLLGSHWFYSIPVLAMVTVFYTPRLPLLTSEVQFSLGVLLLAVFWGHYGLSSFLKACSSSATTPIEQRLNSALFSVIVAIMPLWILSDTTLQRIAPLFLAGIIILWLSYQLLMRSLFYAALLVLVTAYLPIKAIYFPTPSGLATVLISIGLWFWLWHRERQATSELIVLKREQIGQKLALLPSCRLIGWLPLPSTTPLFREVIAAPLEQVMCLLWFLGMKTLYSRFFDNQLSYAWLAAIFLIVLFTVLLIIRYSLLKLLPIPIVMKLAAILIMLQFFGLATDSLLLATVIYALLSWQIINYSLSRAGFIRLINELNPKLDDIQQAGYISHHTALFMVMVGVICQMLNATSHSVTVLLTLISTVGFLWLSDRRYKQLIVRYLVLGFGVLAGFELVFILQPAFNITLLFVLLSLAVGALSVPATAYAKPSANTAIFLVFIAICLQLQHIVQTTAIITPLDYTVLLLAGFSLLIANSKYKSAFCAFTAFAVWVLAILWLENSLVHAQQPFYLWLNTPFVDLWLLLAFISLAITVLSQWLKVSQKVDADYLPPLNTVAMLCFVWALLGTLTLFVDSAGHGDYLALIFGVLLLALFLLSKNRSGATELRGLGSACLPTLAAFSLLPVGLDSFALQTIVVGFGYTLWLFATLLLPRFNQRYSEWTITPDYFPWLGLLLVVFSHGLWQTLIAADVGIYCLELLGYSLLMFRYSSWAGFAWLAAFTFTAAGVAFNFNEDSLPVNLLLWSNVQLLLGTLWQRKGKKLAEQWQWHTPPLADAFAYTTRFIFISYLLIASIMLVVALLDGIYAMDKTLLPVISIGILLALSFLHLLWLRFSSVALHGFIHSLFLLLWSVYFTQFNHLFQPPLLLALWSLLLLSMGQIRITAHTDDIARALRYWLHASVILATLALLTYTEHTLGELILSLAIVTGLSAALGGKNTNSHWLLMAKIEALLLLHGWVFLLLGHTTQTFALLLPWYALQNTLLGVLSMWFLNRLLTKPMSSENQAYYEQVLRGTSWLMVLGLLQLLGHGLFIQNAIMAGQQAQWLFSPLDSIAAFITGAIIVTVGVRHVRHLPDSGWLYAIIALIGALGFYGRLLWLGSASVSLWDTSLLIGSAYLLFFLQRIFPSKPLLNMALLMPVLAIFTVPLQLASPETSITLMVTGLLYAMMRRYNQQKIPLYMAMLAFNASVYLWVPNLVDSSRLIQVYVIPAALSCLLLLQMHSRELKPSVLMGSRLAAISSIYACATVDVFLRAEAEQLGVFILAMALSVAGIVLGIALRTRAFLYAGVSFLLLNVLGQLRLPDQGMGKAIVLMVMGATIMVFMIWFNIKRAEILQRIGAIKAEMQTWE
jgi:hypothetical protein